MDSSDLSLPQLKVELMWDLLGIDKNARLLGMTELEAKVFLRTMYSGVDHLTLDQIFTDGGFFALLRTAYNLSISGFDELQKNLDVSLKHKARELPELYFELTSNSLMQSYSQSLYLLPGLRLPPEPDAERLKATARKLEELCSKLEPGEYRVRGRLQRAGPPGTKDRRVALSITKSDRGSAIGELVTKYRVYSGAHPKLECASESLLEVFEVLGVKILR